MLRLVSLEELVDLRYEALFIDWLIEDAIHANIDALVDRILVLKRRHGKYNRLDKMRISGLLAQPIVGIKYFTARLIAIHYWHL